MFSFRSIVSKLVNYEVIKKKLKLTVTTSTGTVLMLV